MFFRKPYRRFTVHGRIGVLGPYDQPDRYMPGSVTLRAKNHDDAEKQARESFQEGDAWFAYRWFKVDRVVEHRGRR